MFIRLLIFFLLISIIIAICFHFSNIVLLPKVRDYDETYINEVKKGRINRHKFESLTKKNFYIKSPYGYNLNAIFIPSNNSKKTIIFCHGIKCNLNNSLKYIDIFLKRGFNILVYDQRNHGKSGGKYTTYGFYEKFDLKACTDWVINQSGRNSIIGIHGESMGAATAIQNAAIDDRVSFYIADCPYSDLVSLLKIRIREDYKLPPFSIIPIASLINKLRVNIFYNQVSPIKNIKNIKAPILFIHGEKDDYIPNYMSKDMYSKNPVLNRLYISPNSSHAESYIKNPKEYTNIVETFLKEINIY